MNKIQVVPLWIQDLEEIRRCCGRIHYRWYAAKYDDKAEYLGVFLGPGKGSHSWDKARSKMVRKAKDLDCTSLSLLYAVKVYNTYSPYSLLCGTIGGGAQ